MYLQSSSFTGDGTFQTLTKSRSVDDDVNGNLERYADDVDSTVSRSIPDFSAVPKRSILKKSSSYVGISETTPAALGSNANPNSSFADFGPSTTGVDYVRSPSLPLLYRQRTFGGPPAMPPRMSTDVGLRRLGTAHVTRGTTAGGQPKRVTFSV
jgi:hypothetical protein